MAGVLMAVSLVTVRTTLASRLVTTTTATLLAADRWRIAGWASMWSKNCGWLARSKREGWASKKCLALF
jgi:hypothetical protein